MSGGRVVDAHGRDVLLRGVNVNAFVEYWAYDPARFTTYPFSEADADLLAELGFTVVFYLVAATSFSWLITYYAAHRFDGAPGLGLADIPALRWPLIIAIVAGVALMVAALAVYPRLPSALFEQRMRGPRGIERISRHPFFAGTALFAIAHALLATHAVGTVFFSGFALLSVLGAWHQDQKLLARRGRAYADYLTVTSAIPFAAIIAGRQSLVWSELEVGSLAVGVVVALALQVLLDLLRRKQRPLRALAGRVADQPGAAAHQDDRLVPAALQVRQQHQR